MLRIAIENVALATKILHFSSLLILFYKCSKLYLIMTVMSEHVKSQFLLKGHKVCNFLFVFCLKISKTLKSCIPGLETDINKQ